MTKTSTHDKINNTEQGAITITKNSEQYHRTKPKHRKITMTSTTQMTRTRIITHIKNTNKHGNNNNNTNNNNNNNKTNNNNNNKHTNKNND